jgi:MFS family permease
MSISNAQGAAGSEASTLTPKMAPAVVAARAPRLTRQRARVVFAVFAFTYFFSALIRSITATLSPTLTQEFALNARDLGLLAGGYFLGFSATQLPLGAWLDRYGPKRVLMCFLTLAVAGCIAFSLARGFGGLLAARILCGIGVSACLMAPLTGYRKWFDTAGQLRANSWMLMSGSLGMVASSLPVQWLTPIYGWRPLFWGLAAFVLLAIGLVAWLAPGWGNAAEGTKPPAGGTPGLASPHNASPSYAEVWRHPYFRKMVPIGFFCYGGLLAMQTLWVVPWMTRVADYTPIQAATGFFWINVSMLLTFWAWGLVNPWLARRGLKADQLIAWGLPASFAVLALLIAAGRNLGNWSEVVLALYCMACSFVALSQPAVGMAFPQALAGRALSAYNLVLFAGIFTVQWGIGLLIDGFKSLGFTEPDAYRCAFAVFLLCCMAAYAHFVTTQSDNRAGIPHE